MFTSPTSLYERNPYRRHARRNNPGVLSGFRGSSEEFKFLQQHYCPSYYEMPQETRIAVASKAAFGVWDAYGSCQTFALGHKLRRLLEPLRPWWSGIVGLADWARSRSEESRGDARPAPAVVKGCVCAGYLSPRPHGENGLSRRTHGKARCVGLRVSAADEAQRVVGQIA